MAGQEANRFNASPGHWREDTVAVSHGELCTDKYSHRGWYDL